MAFDPHSLFGYSTVLTAPSPATSGTSLVVQAGDGTKFSVGQNVALWPSNVTAPTKSNAEISRITAIATDTLTITRAQEGSTAQTVAVGWQIANVVTPKIITDIEDYLDGTTSEASLDTPTLTTPNIAQSSTGNPATVTASGSDANIDLELSPKGTGIARIGTSAKMRAYTATAQSIPATTATKVQLGTEDYDPGSNYDNATNYRFTAPIAGYYLIHGEVTFQTSGTGERVARIYKNGSEVAYRTNPSSSSTFTSVDITAILNLEASDYIELYCSQTSGGALALGNSGTQRNWMEIHLLSV